MKEDEYYYNLWRHENGDVFFLTNVHWNLLTLYHFWHAFEVVFLIIVITTTIVVVSICRNIPLVFVIIACGVLMMMMMTLVELYIILIYVHELNVWLQETHWALAANFLLFTIDKIIIYVNGKFIITVRWHNVISILISLDIFINWLAKR